MSNSQAILWSLLSAANLAFAALTETRSGHSVWRVFSAGYWAKWTAA